MKLTERDRNLLHWVHCMGFADVDLIARLWRVARSTAYGRTKKLVDHQYLKRAHVLHDPKGVYLLGKAGRQASSLPLARMHQVPLASYRHDRCVAHLSLVLQEQFHARFIPERVLRHELGQAAFARKGHLCDGILLMQDQRIAIEVELTKKSERRLQQILRHYQKNFTVDAVWYFCGNKEVQQRMQKHSKAHSFLRVFRLQDYLPEQEEVRAVV